MKFTILILRFVSILSIGNTDTLEVIVENCCQVVLMAVIMIDLEETRLFAKKGLAGCGMVSMVRVFNEIFNRVTISCCCSFDKTDGWSRFQERISFLTIVPFCMTNRRLRFLS